MYIRAVPAACVRNLSEFQEGQPCRITLAALAAGTVTMPTHKFQVGEHVQWSEPYRHITVDIYEIIKQFPESNGEFHYRIKGFDEPHARMATESELGPLSDHHKHSLMTDSLFVNLPRTI
jgi:hypothetical protein